MRVYVGSLDYIDHLDSRQIPIMLESNRYVIMEITELLPKVNNQHNSYHITLQEFMQSMKDLNLEEVSNTFSVSAKEVISLMSQVIPCVGCRKSVEGLLCNMQTYNDLALKPILLLQNDIALDRGFLKDPCLIYDLLYKESIQLKDILDTIPKNRRNKRCPLHSLDSHKYRSSGIWIDVWISLSQECREEIVTIDSQLLLGTTENYLRKHKFCSECRAKVIRAFAILLGELDIIAEKEYRKDLYDGIGCCCNEHCRCIKVRCDTDFIAHLIDRAEPEISGRVLIVSFISRREHHAKSMEAAQEEILTCIGIHLWERLHRLWQKLRTEEQTWIMLFYLCIESLRRKSEIVLRGGEGETRLEKILQEFSEADKAKETKREQKRLKRKKRRTKEITDGIPCKAGIDCRANTLPFVESEYNDSNLKSSDSCHCLDTEDQVDQDDTDVGSNSSDATHDSKDTDDYACHSCENGDHLPNKNQVVVIPGDSFIPDEEIELLNSMGWSEFVGSQHQDCQSENIEISEKDIEDYEANKKVIRIRRDKLREKLRHQFQNIAIGK
ncbi:Gametogenetin-binding protein 2 [Trichoplax sp. H2]|nr:Gametogenetin-binding protein 2 [Trichoplax sp. H2]|eukprot:RDD47507.1 Gametogenetin-binding protein 2 [Trichoplax sp. H2]